MYNYPVLREALNVMSQAPPADKGGRKLPLLLMRTVMVSVATFPELKNFVATVVLVRLVQQQVRYSAVTALRKDESVCCVSEVFWMRGARFSPGDCWARPVSCRESRMSTNVPANTVAGVVVALVGFGQGRDGEEIMLHGTFCKLETLAAVCCVLPLKSAEVFSERYRTV